jgi:N-acetylmuramoyl-L-alanine amidase
MTRTTDTQVSLPERVEIANRANANLLISVHNNALPDGGNPWLEHGTSTYWYHPQALFLARDVRESMLNSLGFVDFSTRWQNLALCRPSRMPAALVEVGFMIHPDEYAQLITAGGQQKAALGIYRGLKHFLSGRPPSAAKGSKRKRRHAK